jgi:hypothetical protein
MKNLILTLVLFISLSGNTQVEKKTWLLGGNAGVSSGNLIGTNISLNPNVGYFVSKRFCPGISTMLNYRKHEDIQSFSLSLSTFTRFYFGIYEKSSFYGLVSFDLAPLFVSSNAITSLGLGHVWFLNKNIGFETQLSGLRFEKRYHVGLRFGLQIYLNRNNQEKAQN